MLKMRITRMMAMGLLLAAMGMTGCKNSLKTENENLAAENKTLRDQLADRNSALDSCDQERKALNQQLAEVRKGGSGGSMAGANNPFSGIPGVTGSAGPGEVTASVDSDLLFDSGKTSLKPTAKKSLGQVASVLKSTYGSSSIRVSGHTDSDPIKKSHFPSNYHLGFERAWAVREYLISKGVPSNRLSLASYGPDAPKGNSKPQNRRVEIVVLLNGAAPMSTASANTERN